MCKGIVSTLRPTLSLYKHSHVSIINLITIITWWSGALQFYDIPIVSECV